MHRQIRASLFAFPGIRRGHSRMARERKRALREAPLRADGTRSLLAKAVGYLKMNSSKRIHERHPELQLWQRGYYEHVIRNEKDHLEICEYMENNPARWVEDRYYQA